MVWRRLSRWLTLIGFYTARLSSKRASGRFAAAPAGVGPVGAEPEEVACPSHVDVVETGFGQAAVASAVSAVTDGLVHGAPTPSRRA